MNRIFSSYVNGSSKFDHFVPEFFQGLLSSAFNVDKQPTVTELMSVYKTSLSKSKRLSCIFIENTQTVIKINKLQLKLHKLCFKNIQYKTLHYLIII